MSRFLISALLLTAGLFADKIEVVKVNPSPYNENAIIKKIYSENGIVGDKTPLILQIAEFPVGVSLPNAPQSLKGMRENGSGSTILLWIYGKNQFQKRMNISVDDGVSFLESRSYFKDRYRKYIELEGLDGTKVAIIAIFVKGYGESIKSSKATKSVVVDYKKRSDQSDKFLLEGLNKPHLVYNEPYGNFEKDHPILLDFYVGGKNVDIGSDAYKVELYIDGTKEETLTEWAPYRIRNLPPGIHEFELVLIDPKGNRVSEPFGPQKNKIRVGD